MAKTKKSKVTVRAERKQWLLDNAEMIIVRRRVKEKIGDGSEMLEFDWSVDEKQNQYWRGQWVQGKFFGLYMKGSSNYERDMKCVRSYWTSQSRLVYEMVKGGTKLVSRMRAEIERRAKRKEQDKERKTGQAKQLADLKAGLKALGVYGREEEWGSDWNVRDTKKADKFADAITVEFAYEGTDSQRVMLQLNELPMARVMEMLPFLLQAVAVARGNVDEDVLKKAKEKLKREAAERGEGVAVPKRHIEM